MSFTQEILVFEEETCFRDRGSVKMCPPISPDSHLLDSIRGERLQGNMRHGDSKPFDAAGDAPVTTLEKVLQAEEARRRFDRRLPPIAGHRTNTAYYKSLIDSTLFMDEPEVNKRPSSPRKITSITRKCFKSFFF